MLPDYYNGNNSFDTWVSHFECVSEINGWTEEEKLLWVRVSLRGRAHVAYDCFAHETRAAYITVKEAIRERFEPPCKSELYKLELERYQKKAGDSWQWWIQDGAFGANAPPPHPSRKSRPAILVIKILETLCQAKINLAIQLVKICTFYYNFT